MVSMTGFGQGEATRRGATVVAELASVNRRQFDVRVALPRVLSGLEAQVTELIHACVSRGCVTGSIRLTSANPGGWGARLDGDAARTFVRELRRVARDLKLKDDLGATALLNVPGLVDTERPQDSAAEIWPLVKKAVSVALADLVRMRRCEGRALEKDLRGRLRALAARVEHVRKRAPLVSSRYRKQLSARLEAAGVSSVADDPQILKEVALFADRCDISEEIVRLDSHFHQADELMGSSKQTGRALDFLCQEMFREINTIASKANDARISEHVIAFKSELEAIREQVQNVE